MSLRREVFIRILALLQRKTLIETKNHTLKFLKPHFSTVRSMKNFAVLTKDGAFALFFRPHPGGFDSSSVPIPRNLPSKAKNNANARGSARQGGGRAGRRWNWLMHNRNKNRNPGSNPDLSYPNLSPLPLHYHTDPLKFRKTLSTYASKLFFLC